MTMLLHVLMIHIFGHLAKAIMIWEILKCPAGLVDDIVIAWIRECCLLYSTNMISWMQVYANAPSNNSRLK